MKALLDDPNALPVIEDMMRITESELGELPGKRSAAHMAWEHLVEATAHEVGRTMFVIDGSTTEEKAIRAAVDRSTRMTLNDIKASLGIKHQMRFPERREETTTRSLAFLADESIALLERCVKSNSAPHAGTVAEMRNRLDRLRFSR